MEFQKKLEAIRLKGQIDLALTRISLYTCDMELLMHLKKMRNETLTDEDILKCLSNIKEQIKEIEKLQHKDFLNTIGGKTC